MKHDQIWHNGAEPFIAKAEPWLLYPLFGSGTLTILTGEAKYAGKSRGWLLQDS